jgi:hypothetical protein
MFLLKNFYAWKGVKWKSQITFMMIHFHPRGQGAGVPPKANVRRLGWLKQLKVAISTRASVPSEQSPQNSWNKFCRLTLEFLWFQNQQKDSWRVRETKTLDESFQISNCHEICGRVTFLLNKNVFIALVTYKISIKYHYITSNTQRVQYESSTMWPGSRLPLSAISLA